MIANTTVTREHHARLQRHVDRLAVAAALVGTGRDAELRERLDEATAFLGGLLLPHMEAAERVLFPELERLMQNRHSMTPMRREHELIRSLIGDLETRREALGAGALSTGAGVALRRALYRLHGLLMAHLAEEQLYADLVEHGLTPAEEATLAEALDHAGTASF
jgi:iron-sulfur cluster repair protein YtfE (RIC family)